MSGLFDLSGQVVLITGAAGGLGRAIARACVDHGAAVVLSDRDGGELELAAQSLRDAGAQALAVAADLADAAATQALAEAAWAWQGRLDTLVCNAGLQGPAGPLADASDGDWQLVFDVNLRSASRLTATLLPRMAQQGGGSVVLMSSIAGLRGNKAIGLYGLSKAALAQLARNVAVEWGPKNIRANAVSPGLIRTPLAARLLADPSFIERRLSLTPLRRIGEPEEIAAVVVLLAGRGGAFITGQNLVVDGGTTISDGN